MLALGMLLLVLSPVHASISRGQSQPQPPLSAPVELQFAWPDSGSVQLKIEREREGHAVSFDLVMRWTQRGTGRVVTLENPQVESLDGSPPVGEDAHQLAAWLEGIESLIPAWWVDEAGRWTGAIEDLTGAQLDSLADGVALRHGLSDSLRTALRETLAEPLARGGMRERGAQIWELAVGQWSGMRLEPDEIVAFEDTLLFGGLPIPANGIRRALTELKRGGKRYVGLESTLQIDPQASRAALQAASDSLARELSRPIQTRIESLSRTVHCEVLVDPHDLRPQILRLETWNMLTHRDGRQEESYEHSILTFHWSW
jgi:hypothetical protein